MSCLRKTDARPESLIASEVESRRRNGVRVSPDTSGADNNSEGLSPSLVTESGAWWMTASQEEEAESSSRKGRPLWFSTGAQGNPPRLHWRRFTGVDRREGGSCRLSLQPSHKAGGANRLVTCLEPRLRGALQGLCPRPAQGLLGFYLGFFLRVQNPSFDLSRDQNRKLPDLGSQLEKWQRRGSRGERWISDPGGPVP